MRHSTGEVFSAIAVSTAEWLFAMLPLVVVGIVMAHLGKFTHFTESAEWAFGAAVLSAQSLVRFVGGVARAKGMSLERVLLGLAVLLVVVLGPTNVILGLVVRAELEHPGKDHGLALTQVLLFCIASLLFISLAAASHLWSHAPKDSNSLRV